MGVKVKGYGVFWVLGCLGFSDFGVFGCFS